MYEEIIKSLRLCREILHEDDSCIEFVDGSCEAFPICTYQLMEKAADAIEELSRRETPMRLRITTSTKRCPSCNKQVSGIGNIHGNYRYCRWCGQAIDWSEPPKEEQI